MIFSICDFIEIFKILLILSIGCFSLYFPLRLIFNAGEGALKFSIPLSISAQIIFGYIFYTLGKIELYYTPYLAIILLLNLWSIYKLKPKLNKINFGSKSLTIALIALVIAAVYHFFADSIRNIAPGTIDTTNHLAFLFTDLPKLGYLNFPSYPSGFHIFLYPLTKFSSQVPVYRFTGPILGLYTISHLVLTFRNIFQNKILSALLVAAILLLPFNQLVLQLIGFFPTALSFIFFASFLVLVIEEKISYRLRLFLGIIMAIATGVTIPYLSVQLAPIFLILALVAKLFLKSKLNLQAIKIALLSVILCFLVGFGHVYLQTGILKRTTGFPAIETVIVKPDGNVTTTTTYQATKRFTDKLSHYLPFIKNHFFQNYIIPMLMTGEDILKIKNIRPPIGILSLGAYIIMLTAVGSLVFIKNKPNLTVVSLFVLVFGVATQTGILEISTYRGRSGYYLLFLAPILACLIIDHYYKSKLNKYGPLAIGILALTSTLSVPLFYREYYPDYFQVSTNIVDSQPGKKFLFFTSKTDLKTISSRIQTRPLSENISLDDCGDNECFVIIEKKPLFIDPILSQKAYSADKNGAQYNAQQIKEANDQQALAQRIIEKLNLSSKLYTQTANLEVYNLR